MALEARLIDEINADQSLTLWEPLMRRPTLVVDASVAVKWILPEEGHKEAIRIQDKFQDEKVDLISPYLVVAEVANVLWKRARLPKV
jgi:predicted nucleic acid-binding protein